jgi:hypothetical protein
MTPRHFVSIGLIRPFPLLWRRVRAQMAVTSSAFGARTALVVVRSALVRLGCPSSRCSFGKPRRGCPGRRFRPCCAGRRDRPSLLGLRSGDRRIRLGAARSPRAVASASRNRAASSCLSWEVSEGVAVHAAAHLPPQRLAAASPSLMRPMSTSGSAAGHHGEYRAARPAAHSQGGAPRACDQGLGPSRLRPDRRGRSRRSSLGSSG